MATKKISELPTAVSPISTDKIVIVRVGTTYQALMVNEDTIQDGSTYKKVNAVVATALNTGTYGYLYDGISWDENTDTYVRLGRTATADPNYLTVQKGMRRCVVTDAGEVAYYLFPTNSALKEDGVTASVLDGTDGQVMVEIPKFYYQYSYVGTVHTWKISELKLAGFEVHPLFLSGTTELSKAFVGAFEASLYDVSASKYVGEVGLSASAATFASADKSITCTALTAPFTNMIVGTKIVVSGASAGNNGTRTVVTVAAQKITIAEAVTDETIADTTIVLEKDVTATTGDKLASVSAVPACILITRAQARVLASNRGTGWTQLTYDMESAIQLLYLIEYNSFYSQNKIGAGITNVTDWAVYNNYYPISKGGNSVPIGNTTGNTAGAASAATESTKYISYRGIENPFGHIWKWVDGININNNIAYVCNVRADLADNTASNYTLIGTLINNNGYQNTLLATSRGFLPKTVGANSATKITDYYYQFTNWRVVAVGGAADNGASAGFFAWLCSYASAAALRNIGARLGLLK